ncbi:MIP/aquaporin family protein [Agromyces bauzanensis]|uniref:Glycerol uptake transporter protein n=1 Tax=Agromyces bauzanensis TaxID=1308924 RepID=A0A917PIH4_9MICO|nr:MIP/aquaporin family protein [Agromyces bauzanensis]GGJ80653.1 glycerol uptake transporter protein [Agromyces bauzanensis]
MSAGSEPRPAPSIPLSRRLLAEFIGTGLLVAVVVGSGIAASTLSPDDTGLQLLENSFSTALGLGVLIAVLAPVSGAQLNPVVSIADWFLGRRARGGLGLAAGDLGPYIAVQVLGAVAGAVLANVMFGVQTSISATERVSAGSLVAEVVATAGLIVVIFALVRTGRTAIVAPAVGAYIGAAYWFTSSTSFANPAVTVGRIFSDTFAGISPDSAIGFVLAQLLGAAIGVVITSLLFPAAVGEASEERERASAVG